MLTLQVKIREVIGKNVKTLRHKDIIPAILYGPGLKNTPLEVDLKEFQKAYSQAGESSLIQLLAESKKFLVLIQAVEIESISQKPIHIDFYQPKLDEEITAMVPLLFEGEAPAVKELGGTLVRNIHELEVKALPQNLLYNIKVDITKLKTFEDDILIKDLIVPKEVKVLKEPDETICFVAEPEKIEEELAKPVEEKVEEVEKVKEKEEKGEEEEKEEKKA